MKSKHSFFTNPKEAFRDWLELGYHIEPGVWSARECDDLIAASHELEQYVSGRLVPAMQPHRTDERFFHAMAHPRVVEIMSHLIASGDPARVRGLQTELFYGK